MVLRFLVLHLVNKFKVSIFIDMIEEQWLFSVNWFEQFKGSVGDMFSSNPHFSPIDWNVLQGRLYAANDYRKDQISFHNSHLTFCWVNLKVFPTLACLGTRYCLIFATRGNIVCIDTGTCDTICISFTLAIRYIDVSVNRYTPNKHLKYFLWNCYQVNATTPHWSLVNIGSGNGLVPSGNKPLPESMLT